MRVEKHKVDISFSVRGSVDGKAYSGKAGTDKAVLKVDGKKFEVVRKGHDEYKVKMHHVHHGDHIAKETAREMGEQAIKTARKFAHEARKSK